MISVIAYGTIGRHSPELIEGERSVFATFSLRCEQRVRGRATFLLVRVDGPRAARVVQDFRRDDRVIVNGELTTFTQNGRTTLQLRANSIAPVLEPSTEEDLDDD